MSTRSQTSTSSSPHQPQSPSDWIWHQKCRLTCPHLTSARGHRRCFLVCTVTVGMIILVTMATQRGMPLDYTSASSLVSHMSLHHEPSSCPNFLVGAAKGRWVQLPMTAEDVKKMDEFQLGIFKARHLSPYSQRADEKCGNVTFEANSGQQEDSVHAYHSLFRALCDPRGPRPCCLQGRCVNRVTEQCRCKECYDWRRLPHAEFARWVTSDPRCQPLNFTGTQACRFLGKAFLVFYGDSMIRNFYTALLMLLREDPRFGALEPSTPEDIKLQCEGVKMFGQQMCVHHMKPYDTVCQGKVKVNYIGYRSARSTAQAVGTMRHLLHLNSTFLLANLGFDDHLHVSAGMTFLRALHAELQRARATWPHLIWVSTNAPGLLRSDVNSPSLFAQNAAVFRHYHEETTRQIAELGVPVLDTWSLTGGALSFDGIHVGLGLNLQKCHVLLSYLQLFLDHHRPQAPRH